MEKTGSLSGNFGHLNVKSRLSKIGIDDHIASWLDADPCNAAGRSAWVRIAAVKSHGFTHRGGVPKRPIRQGYLVGEHRKEKE